MFEQLFPGGHLIILIDLQFLIIDEVIGLIIQMIHGFAADID